MADGQTQNGLRMENSVDRGTLVELTSEIVSAYVGSNPVPSTDLPGLIHDVFATLGTLDGPAPRVAPQDLQPAVPVKKSVQDDFIICLEDGKKFKSLKRHLRAKYGMSPEEYREKWGLPHDYPMVAPSYARERSRLAKKMGLGQSR